MYLKIETEEVLRSNFTTDFGAKKKLTTIGERKSGERRFRLVGCPAGTPTQGSKATQGER